MFFRFKLFFINLFQFERANIMELFEKKEAIPVQESPLSHHLIIY